MNNEKSGNRKKKSLYFSFNCDIYHRLKKLSSDKLKALVVIMSRNTWFKHVVTLFHLFDMLALNEKKKSVQLNLCFFSSHSSISGWNYLARSIFIVCFLQ